MNVTPVNSPSAPAPSAGYSQALDVHDFRRLLFVSGQIPESIAGEISAGFEAQAKQVWANVFAQLEAAAMSVGHLVKVTTFLSSREHAVPNRKACEQVLATHGPALTVIATRPARTVKPRATCRRGAGSFGWRLFAAASS